MAHSSRFAFVFRVYLFFSAARCCLPSLPHFHVQHFHFDTKLCAPVTACQLTNEKVNEWMNGSGSEKRLFAVHIRCMVLCRNIYVCTTCTYMNLIICTIFLLLMWVVRVCFSTKFMPAKQQWHHQNDVKYSLIRTGFQQLLLHTTPILFCCDFTIVFSPIFSSFEHQQTYTSISI